MRAVVQRVSSASVRVGGNICGQIECGLLVFAAIEKGDGEKDLKYMALKIGGLRVFEDESGRMDRDVNSFHGKILVVPQFTIAGNVQSGRRPSFVNAEAPDRAKTMLARFVTLLKAGSNVVLGGVFQEHMEVEIVNDGPVTILVDSRRVF